MMEKTLFSLIIALLSITIIYACLTAVYHKGDVRMKKIENSPQYKDGKFRNYVDTHNTISVKT